MLQQDSAEVPLVLLTITHPSFPEPIRLVNNGVSSDGSTNIVRPEGTYVAFPFDLELPSDMDNEGPKAKLTVSNVSREIVAIARTGGEAPQVTLEVIAGTSPLEPGPKFGPLRFGTPEITDLTVSTDLVSTDESLMSATYLRFDAVHFPAMLRAAS
jgi:hypothetical protein